jgi:hypothetical protein
MICQLLRCTAITAASAALALGLGACSTPTTEISVWQNPSYRSGPMKNIAVFGGRMTESDRRTLEDGYVRTLATYGVHAAPAYSLFPQGEVPHDQAAVRSTLQSGGYDGALVSTLKGVHEQVFVAPGASWDGGFYNGFWGPGPTEVGTDQFVKFETSLWSVGSGSLVWSTTTQTENPTSNRNFVSSLTGTVVPSLSQAGLIPPSGKPVSLLRRPSANSD